VVTDKRETEPEDLEYVTRVDVNIAILREISKIRLRERLRTVMPIVAQNLVAAGVDFSRVDFSKVTEPGDAELNAVYEDLL
jgi:hypothetical protein